MINALSVAASRQWLITREGLQTIIDVANRSGDVEALATRLGRPLDNAQKAEKRGNVAVIPVTGPIFRYANLFTQISGATSTEVLATDIQAALDDPTIKAIVLDVNSPGGEATGINELAQMVYDARSRKPITAYAGGMMASAAYWIGSAASRIVVDPTALLGSIGVVSEIEDTSERDAKSGKRTYTIVSSNAPYKRADPGTESGRAQVQRVVDELADVFVGAVARNRNVSRKAVLDKYGQGGVLVGRQAVAAGMADAIGSLESVIASATSVAPRSSQTQSSVQYAPISAQSSWDQVVAGFQKRHIEAESRKNAILGRSADRPQPAQVDHEAPAVTSGGMWDQAIAKVRQEQERCAGDMNAARRRMAGR